MCVAIKTGDKEAEVKEIHLVVWRWLEPVIGGEGNDVTDDRGQDEDDDEE